MPQSGKHSALATRGLLLLLLGIAVILISVGSYLRWWNLEIYAGSYLVHHWLSWMGAVYIALLTPLYSLLKRRYPFRMKGLINLHMFGNLLAFGLVSLHFTQLTGRPDIIAPAPGTGFAQYMIMSVMVITGLAQRCPVTRRMFGSWRFVHVGLVISFYIVLAVHIHAKTALG
jgi:hypothetical protein